jgi:hypothetical protein
MSRDDHQFRIRLPEELRDDLRDLAAANRRSINAEIVARLIESVDQEMVEKWVSGEQYDPAITDFERLDANQAREVVLALKRIKEIFEPIEADRRKFLDDHITERPPTDDYLDEDEDALIEKAGALRRKAKTMIQAASKKVVAKASAKSADRKK